MRTYIFNPHCLNKPMKHSLLFFLLSTLLFSCKNGKPDEPKTDSAHTLTISGKLEGVTEGELVLGFEGDGDMPVNDTIPVKDGSFSAVVEVSSPREMYMSYQEQYLVFFAGPGAIDIKGSPNGFQSAGVEGSGVPKDYVEYKASLKEVEAEMQRLDEEMMDMFGDTPAEEGALDKFDAPMARLEAQKRALDSTFIKKNPSSHYAALLLVYKHGYIPETEKVEADYNALSDDVKTGFYGKKLKKILDVAIQTAVGKPAMDFTLNDADGKPVSLSSYKGKYVLVDFWASWCRPCREENPSVVKAYQKYKSKGFDVFGVSLDEDKDQWLEAVKNDRLTWTHVSDLKGWKSDVVPLYNITGIPYNLLLDKNGNILGKGLFGEDLDKKLAEHLK